MFAYDFDRLNILLESVLQKSLTPESWKWLRDAGKAVRANDDIAKFNIAFVAMPRKTGKNMVTVSAGAEREMKGLRKDLHIKGWTVDQLSRVWLLMQLKPEDKERYIAAIENLFMNGEMGELVALYASIPLLAYPESWRKRCAEGIRSNIGQVLESIICNNPYPAEQLDEAAWNQLVLKAIFTGKPLLEITGLRERRNPNLAQSLVDYAHERWAAHRELNPVVWICVSPFIVSANFSDIQHVFHSEDPLERDAAALACYESPYEPARKMVDRDENLKRDIQSGKITWEAVAERL